MRQFDLEYVQPIVPAELNLIEYVVQIPGSIYRSMIIYYNESSVCTAGVSQMGP